MPDSQIKKHIQFKGHYQNLEYKYPRQAHSPGFKKKDRNRNFHGVKDH